MQNAQDTARQKISIQSISCPYYIIVTLQEIGDQDGNNDSRKSRQTRIDTLWREKQKNDWKWRFKREKKKNLGAIE